MESQKNNQAQSTSTTRGSDKKARANLPIPENWDIGKIYSTFATKDELKQAQKEFTENISEKISTHEKYHHELPEKSKKEFLDNWKWIISVFGLAVITGAIFLIRYWVKNEIFNMVDKSVNVKFESAKPLSPATGNALPTPVPSENSNNAQK